jgi:threonine aldolase
VKDARGLIDSLAGEVQLSGPVDRGRVRAVTHMDVSRPDIDVALTRIQEVVR